MIGLFNGAASGALEMPQAQSPSIPAADKQAPSPLGDLFLSNEVGMSLQLPKNAVVVTRQYQPNAFFLVRDGMAKPRWSLRLESLQSDDPTAEILIKRLMLAQEQGKDSPDLEILKDTPFSTEESTGHLIWVKETLPDDSQVIFGWLVVPQGRIAGKLHYIIATAVTVPAMFPDTQTVLEKAFKTILVRGPQVAIERAITEAQATRTFLEGLTEERLRAMDGHTSVRRAYRPGKNGQPDEEIAYTIFSIETQPMGVIHNNRPESDYSPAEKEEGILVKVHSRVVADKSRDIYLDMLGLYWMAFDLSHESWTARVTRRQGAATRVEKEFGFRPRTTLGQPRPRVVVIKQDDEINLREPYEWEAPDPWMPRPMTWMLGYLLPRTGEVAMSYACIDHREKVPTLGTRRDEWSPDSTNPDQWQLQTWLDDSGLPTSGLYDDEGLVNQRNADGMLIETTSPEQLKMIWDAAGLKTR
ncbi:MAG: hypothetical protein CMJ40_01880 [Phycisphaerae bacterium]|nr:hypothetical protein [Phycisphaerae bacterium]